MKEQIVHIALENLEKNTGIKAKWKPCRAPYDGTVDLMINKNKETCLVEVKKEFRHHHLIQLLEYVKGNAQLLVIAENIFAKVKRALRENGLAYIDAAGNIFIKTDRHYIWIEGNKRQDKKEKINRAFTKTGLKVVFLFLRDETHTESTYREIANNAGVALGNLNYVMNGLKEAGLAVALDKRRFKLINKKALLERFITAYADKLKPTLHIGTFRFLKENDLVAWKDVPLAPGKTYWGGEPAGELFTGWLKPAIFTVYTTETRNELIKNYRLVPNPDGNIEVYRKFWKHGEVNDNVVPPLLAYADLINTGDNRCIETARKLYDQYLKENI